MPFDHVGQVKQAIIAGTESDASQDSAVMLVLYDTEPGKRSICTGTLIAPNLVITARHCVAISNGLNISCDVDGTPLSGGEILGNVDPANLFVFTGKDRPPFTHLSPVDDMDSSKWAPASQASEILDDQSGNLCSHDIALLLLKTPITNVPIASIRLDRDVTANETITAVGWGVTVPEQEPSHRQQRSNVVIDRVGPDPSYPLLTKTEFSFGESICLGDSGGPILDQNTKALVGITSRGGNATSSGTFAEKCIDARNLATKLSPFKQLITDAFNRAGAQPKLEPPPDDDDCAMSPGPKRTSVPAIFGVLALVSALLLRRRTT